MDHHRESRKRLRPWLERMIVSGECPGLVWENREERTFRIPWRHFNNKDWVEKDSKIFMEWAKYTGKYHDGDRMEYPVWKTRLRCALKKIPEIKELPDLHQLEDADPYRVYQFVDTPGLKKVSDVDSDYSTSPASYFTNSPAARDFLEESATPPPQKYFNEIYQSQKQLANVPTVVFDEDPFNCNNLAIKTEEAMYPQHFNGAIMDDAKCPPKLEHRNFPMQYPCFDNFNVSSQQDFGCTMPTTSHNYSDLNMISPSQPVLHLLRHETAEMQTESMKTSLPSDLRSLESNDLCPLGLNSVPSINMSESGSTTGTNVMQLTLRYGSPKILVYYTKVAANGCRLYYGAPQLQNTILEEELFGPKTVTQIEMPDVKNDQNISSEQKRFIYELLENMERGLVLTYKDGDIYAQRLCRTRVFVSDGVSESKLLDRKQKTPTKVFDFSAFKASFDSYNAGKTSNQPNYHFYLTFGQEVKKNRSEPMAHVLIHVQVTHNEAAAYASKLSMSESSQSFSAISEVDTNDQLLQNFKNMSVNK